MRAECETKTTPTFPGVATSRPRRRRSRVGRGLEQQRRGLGTRVPVSGRALPEVARTTLAGDERFGRAARRLCVEVEVERWLELDVSSLAFSGRNGHQIGMGLDVRLDDRFGLRHRVSVAVAVDRVGLDEIALVRRRRVDALVDRCHGTCRHAGPAVDALFGMDIQHRRLRELGFTDREIVDITLAAAARNFLSRALLALAVPTDDLPGLGPELVDALLSPLGTAR